MMMKTFSLSFLFKGCCVQLGFKVVKKKKKKRWWHGCEKKPLGRDINSVPSWWHQHRRRLVVRVQPGPFARTPRRLPDAIASSCPERWHHCGRIWKEFASWNRARGDWSFHQSTGSSLARIYPLVCQGSERCLDSCRKWSSVMRCGAATAVKAVFSALVSDFGCENRVFLLL